MPAPGADVDRASGAERRREAGERREIFAAAMHRAFDIGFRPRPELSLDEIFVFALHPELLFRGSILREEIN